jgi:hypothetical protein
MTTTINGTNVLGPTLPLGVRLLFFVRVVERIIRRLLANQANHCNWYALEKAINSIASLLSFVEYRAMIKRLTWLKHKARREPGAALYEIRQMALAVDRLATQVGYQLDFRIDVRRVRLRNRPRRMTRREFLLSFFVGW